MERLGSGNLPGTVGQSSNSSGNGKSRRGKAPVESALRTPDVQDFGNLSLALSYVIERCGFFLDAGRCR